MFGRISRALALVGAMVAVGNARDLSAQGRAVPPVHPSFRVTKVVATVSQPSTKTCPVKLTFTGTITANAPSGTIRYEWIRSDGTTSAPATHAMTAITWKATYVWTTGSKINAANPDVSATLHVLSPNDMTSSPAKTKNHCS